MTDIGIAKEQEFIMEGKKITDHKTIADSFLNFFRGKVAELSKDEKQYTWVRSSEHLTFTEEDIKKAITTYKRKMSSGSDEVAMLLVKDSLPGVLKEFTAFMNRVASNGMPSGWKLAKIHPLHKKDAKDQIPNYRPIANLQSISKVYEKLLLNRIDEMLPDEEGRHQHGFRKNKSTTTALLELQDAIAKGMDSYMKTACYSLDMSAAFDLLRPHISIKWITFHHVS